MSANTNTTKNCLVVDDSTVNTQFLALYFEQIGVSVYTASSARGGYDFVKQGEFNISLIDQHMPEETGTDLILRCAKEDLLKNLGDIYIFTAQNDFDPELHGIADIITGVLYKPLDVSDIEKIIL